MTNVRLEMTRVAEGTVGAAAVEFHLPRNNIVTNLIVI